MTQPPDEHRPAWPWAPPADPGHAPDAPDTGEQPSVGGDDARTAEPEAPLYPAGPPPSGWAPPPSESGWATAFTAPRADAVPPAGLPTEDGSHFDGPHYDGPHDDGPSDDRTLEGAAGTGAPVTSATDVGWSAERTDPSAVDDSVNDAEDTTRRDQLPPAEAAHFADGAPQYADGYAPPAQPPAHGDGAEVGEPPFAAPTFYGDQAPWVPTGADGPGEAPVHTADGQPAAWGDGAPDVHDPAPTQPRPAQPDAWQAQAWPAAPQTAGPDQGRIPSDGDGRAEPATHVGPPPSWDAGPPPQSPQQPPAPHQQPYQQPYPQQSFPQQTYPQQPYPPDRPQTPAHYRPPGQPAHPHQGPDRSGPPATPRPEALLRPTQPDDGMGIAATGWRGRVNRISGGVIKPQPNAQEQTDRRARQQIQRPFSRPMTVVVVQPKGGAGKTPTTIGLASALGVHRGGYVVGWDDNETRGTLAVRVRNTSNQTTTVWDLLGDLGRFETSQARVGDLSSYVRSQGEAQFDALVSDESPDNMDQIGAEEFRRIHEVLQRFYRLIVVDTGNNVRSKNWQAAINAADLVVVVSTYRRDVGFSGSWVLDHLTKTGREADARGAVTVLTASDPTTDPQVRSELLAHFGQRTHEVVEIPYDPLIALGGPMEWTQMRVATRAAWTRAGAAVVNALGEVEQRNGVRL